MSFPTFLTPRPAKHLAWILILGLLLPASACGGSTGSENENNNNEANPCDGVSCGAHGACEPQTGVCDCDQGYTGDICESCNTGYVDDGSGVCVAWECVDAGECDDGQACNGEETCDGHLCQPGTAVSCGANSHCAEPAGSCECDNGYIDDGTGACVVWDCADAGECDDGLACNGAETCDAHVCQPGAPVTCGPNSHCAEPAGSCECDPGYVDVGGTCLPDTCQIAADCDDGLICNGAETCDANNQCQLGVPLTCQANAHCTEPAGSCACDPGYQDVNGVCVASTCPVPRPQVTTHIHEGAHLTLDAFGTAAVEVGSSTDPLATAPTAWLAQDYLDVPLGAPYQLKVFARVVDPTCTPGDEFVWVYDVVQTYAPAGGQPGSLAVDMNDLSIVAWATGWVSPVQYGQEVDSHWQTPELALGPAMGGSTDIVCLGRGGEITLTFAEPIQNRGGADLAVFENGFAATFLELAYVEVSSDGTTFIRFDSATLNSTSNTDPTLLHGLASKYQQGQGTPFDLEVFRQHPAVLDGSVDLNAIRFVRLVDVVGDNSCPDSFGNPILDPYPTSGSAGFDLDAIAVLHTSAVSIFDDLGLSLDDYWDGSGGAGGFTSGSAYFLNNNPGGYWDGFAYSTMRDTTTPGVPNQFSAIPGTGAESTDAYGVAYDASFFTGTPPTVTLTDTTTGYTLAGAYFTNTTYAYLSMLNGDALAKQFGGSSGTDPDWFLLTIHGIDANAQLTGPVDFYLADFRSANSADDYIHDTWQWVDLSGLGDVVGLQFALTSSDTGISGMNTPAYFAIDQITRLP